MSRASHDFADKPSHHGRIPDLLAAFCLPACWSVVTCCGRSDSVSLPFPRSKRNAWTPTGGDESYWASTVAVSVLLSAFIPADDDKESHTDTLLICAPSSSLFCSPLHSYYQREEEVGQAHKCAGRSYLSVSCVC
jgi:hypothetical protein